MTWNAQRGKTVLTGEEAEVFRFAGEAGEEKQERDTRKRVDAKLPHPYNQANLPLIYGE